MVARRQQGFVRGVGGHPGLARSARTPRCLLLLCLYGSCVLSPPPRP